MLTEADVPVSEPAFPVSENTTLNGLTKREYFAAMAMQGRLSNSGMIDTLGGHDAIAEAAVKDADALIDALNK